MFATIDLNELAKARPPEPRLLHLGLALSTGSPDPDLDHELTDRLVGDRDAMPLEKLLAGQGWAKIGVMGTDQRDDGSAEVVRESPATRAAALTRNQTIGAVPCDRAHNL